MKVPSSLPAILSLGGRRPAIDGDRDLLASIPSAERIGATSQGEMSVGLHPPGDDAGLQGNGQLVEIEVWGKAARTGMVAGSWGLVVAAAVTPLVVVEVAIVFHRPVQALCHPFGGQGGFLPAGTDVAFHSSVPPGLSLRDEEMIDRRRSHQAGGQGGQATGGIVEELVAVGLHQQGQAVLSSHL